MQHFKKILDDRHGFTLLEMSIVIAIIGLLAGGLMIGQSVIRSNQLSTLVNDAKYYHRAFVQFEDQYNAVPGDMSTATSIWTSAAGNGNGNGLIYAIDSGNQEVFLAFQHLKMAGLIQGNYTGNAVSGGVLHGVPGTNIPGTSLAQVGYYFFDFDTPEISAGNSTYFQGMYFHPLFIGLYVANGLPSGAFLTPREAKQLDDKFDDGLPGMGSLRTLELLTNCVSGTTPTTATYIVSNATPECRLISTR